MRQGRSTGGSRQRQGKPHDEAFKQLMQEHFFDFTALFFPELHEQLDGENRTFLMQELFWEDRAGRKRTKKSVDLLIRTKMRETNAHVLVHMEAQSTPDRHMMDRMFLYFARIFEEYREETRQIVPIVVLTHDRKQEGMGALVVGVPTFETMRFQVECMQVSGCDWRSYAESDNPVAAALLAQMNVRPEERRASRKAFLRMILRLRKKYTDEQLRGIGSYADLYFDPDEEEDHDLLIELGQEQGETTMKSELMPAWERWGYERGVKEARRHIRKERKQWMEKGKEEGIEKGIEKGKAEQQRVAAVRLLARGLPAEEVADILGMDVHEVTRLHE